MTDKIYMNASEVAEYLGVHKRTIIRWANEGDFPSGFKLSSRVRVWQKETIDKWVTGKMNKRQRR